MDEAKTIELITAALASDEAIFKGFVLVLHSFYSQAIISKITELLQECIPKNHVLLSMPEYEIDAAKKRMLLKADDITSMQSKLTDLQNEAKSASQPKPPPPEPKEGEEAPPPEADPPADDEEIKAKHQKREQEIKQLIEQMYV